MTIVLCGGGSGGHITPLMAVASELKHRHKNARLIYIGERNGKFSQLTAGNDAINERYFVSAGKLRRYHGESWLRRIVDIKTLLLNIRDLFRLLIGVVQAYFLLKRLKPNALFLKGGFVCVPVALAARLNGIPYITHDSDALPGLSNRLAARWARYHAIAMAAEFYPYPAKSVRVVGVPTDSRFRKYTVDEQKLLRQKFGIDNPEAQVLLITGGSLGARRLNDAVINLLPRLLDAHPGLHVLHQYGIGNEDQIKQLPGEFKDRVYFFDFSPEIFHMSAIADVIVARAGASAIADYAAQSKACIVVPNPYLTGGHQLKNAKVYAEAGAAVILQEKEIEDDSDKLYSAILSLLSNPERREELATNLHKLTPTRNAARSISDLLEEIAQ